MPRQWKADFISFRRPGVFRHLYAKKRRLIYSDAELNAAVFWWLKRFSRTGIPRTQSVKLITFMLHDYVERPLSLNGGLDHVDFDKFFVSRELKVKLFFE